jgi:hypothetical protein
MKVPPVGKHADQIRNTFSGGRQVLRQKPLHVGTSQKFHPTGIAIRQTTPEAPHQLRDG